MTAIVGVLCRDGVVIGSDSSVTFGPGPQFRTMEQPIEKLDVIGGGVIIAGTGEVGLGQRFSAIVRRAWEGKKFTGEPIELGKLLTREFLIDMEFTGLKPGQYGALLAFPIGHSFHLCEFQLKDFQPEFKNKRLWYASMGSGQPITDPFLALMREIFWQEGLPTLQEGVFAVTWTLEHAILINPGGINGPVRIAVLEHGRKGQLEARLVPDTELDEQRQAIGDAKAQLSEWGKRLQTPDREDTETPPKR
jgi:hypothetical protein